MEEDEDYLTCGKCMTEFRLDRITSFIKHKKKDCQELDQTSVESEPELVCGSCPKGFMTAVGLLKHAQTMHNFKLFLERTSTMTGIQGVTVIKEKDSEEKGTSNNILYNSKSLVFEPGSPAIDLTKEEFNEEKQNEQILPIRDGSILPSSQGLKNIKINPYDNIERDFDNSSQPVVGAERFQPSDQLYTNNLGIQPDKNITTKPQTIEFQTMSPTTNIDNELQPVPLRPEAISLPLKPHSDSEIKQSKQETNSLPSVVDAFMKAGVIFPVLNKQMLNRQSQVQNLSRRSEEQESHNVSQYSSFKSLVTGINVPNLKKSSTTSDGNLCQASELKEKEDKAILLPDKDTTQTLLTAENDCDSQNENQMDVAKIPHQSHPLKTQVLFRAPENDMEISQTCIFSKPMKLPLTDGDMNINTQSVFNLTNTSLSSSGEELNLLSEFPASPNEVVEGDKEGSVLLKDSGDNSSIGCCDSKNCGVTIIPGTHEGLKKCCNAVVPKKRKRHFETKHTLTLRQKLLKRITGSASSNFQRNLDKKNGGAIFIDLEPNEDGTLKEMSSNDQSSHSTTSKDNGIGFQVSGLSRDSGNISSKSKGKGSVILPPRAIFSIPISYSLGTQMDGSIRPLVISQHTFQSEGPQPSTVSSTGKQVPRSHAQTTGIHSEMGTSKEEFPQTSDMNYNADDSNDKSLDIDLSPEGQGQSRRRRYPTSRPFKCDKCDSAFNQRIHLKKHMSKHTGVKPFKCNQCSYSTVERSHLKVHIRIHTGEKPFKCTYCEYATAQNSTLKIHLKRHHKPNESSPENQG